MESPPPRANCFDASALVKVFSSDEAGSDVVREYFHNRSPTKYTTPFCFYETLTVLKVKWAYRGDISKDQYTEASFRLVAWFEASARYVRDLDLTKPELFFRARELVDRHSIDFSDAFQILSVKEGYFSRLINESRTVLVTADQSLAKAAAGEGVRAWYCLGDPEP